MLLVCACFLCPCLEVLLSPLKGSTNDNELVSFEYAFTEAVCMFPVFFEANESGFGGQSFCCSESESSIVSVSA